MLATSCSADAALVAGPADCAGPARVSEVEKRAAQWSRVASAFQASSQPAILWVGFSAALDIDEAAAMFSGVQIEGLKFAYREVQGLTVKGTVPVMPPVRGSDLAAPARKSLAFHLQSAQGIHAPAESSVHEGRSIISGLLVRADKRQIASAVSKHQCSIYSLEPGDQFAGLLSPQIEPDSTPVEPVGGSLGGTPATRR